jgi:hypothetical protein
MRFYEMELESYNKNPSLLPDPKKITLWSYDYHVRAEKSKGGLSEWGD